MCRPLLLPILIALLAVATVLPVAAHPYDVWLVIRDHGQVLHFEDGHLVRFEGRGEVEFDTDRRVARLDGDVEVFVDGERVSGDLQVRYGEVVEIRSKHACWTIRTAAEGMPDGQGSRISDHDPESKAVVESDENLVFFVEATDEGGAHFYYPKMSS